MLADTEPSSVLHLGTVPEQLYRCRPVVVAASDARSAQLDRRFALVVVGADAWRGDAGLRRAVVHTAQQHVEPAGHLAVLHRGDTDSPLVDLPTGDLTVADEGAVGELWCTLLRRTDRLTVHDMVFEARRTLQRVTAPQLAQLLLERSDVLVVDTRTPSDRQRFGTIDGAVHLPRTVLEWRVDPTNGYLHPAITGFEQRLVVVCNHGYSSSVAAASLQRLGYSQATDLAGGMRAWRDAGLPVVPPDHTFLEL